MRNQILTRHHVIPKCRKKNKTIDEDQSGLHVDSILKLWENRHIAFHILFKGMTLNECIVCLQRVEKTLLRKQGRQSKRPNDSYFERTNPPSKKKTEPHY